MTIFGRRNLDKLMKALSIPGVSVKVICCWILPIYYVDIHYVGI